MELDARVTGLQRTDGGFQLSTADRTYTARQVIVATGPFQTPFVPPLAAGLDDSVTQLHSADYRSPDALPEGPALVVGGGNSGFQIAEELAAHPAGRAVGRLGLPGAAAAAARPRPVLVADPARA